MPYIQLNDTRHPLRVGAMRVGAGADAELRLPGASDPAAAAVVEVGADQSASIRLAHEDAVVLVNGVRLGAHPAPLLHGDKIELGGCELLYGDDRKGGSTQYVPSMSAFRDGATPSGTPGAPAGNGAAPRAGAPTAATGGLLRSLVDGREYPVGTPGLVIGRDAGCDVVVPSSEVSRRHAVIAPGDAGYELRDTSTNGVWLNGARIQGAATLGRGDVVRIGGEEFRFYADVASPAAAPAATAPAATAPAATAPAAAAPAILPASPAVPPVPDVSPAAVAPTPLVAPMADFELAVPQPAVPEPVTDPARTAPGVAPAGATAAAPAARGALATLEVVNEGVLKGQRFEIRHPLAHVGRGDHNDVVIAEESVSDSHAKLQKREGRWFVSDMGSTNGTYVAGRRVEGEQELAAGADVRFGGIKFRFHPLADRADEGKGTRVIAGAGLDAARRAAAAPQPPAASRRPAPARPAEKAPEKKSSPVLLMVLLFVLIAAAAAFFLGKGR